MNQRPHVLKVLNAALRYHPASDAQVQCHSGSAVEKAVWLLNSGNKPHRIQVTTGDGDGTFTEVSGDGIKDGDRVVIALVAKAGAGTGSGKTSKGPGFKVDSKGAVIEVRNLVKDYKLGEVPVHVLKDISFDL